MTLEALCGDPTIRWGDKSYNSIAYADGTLATTCDVSFFCCGWTPDDWISVAFILRHSFVFCSMHLMTPWCWCLCVGIWTSKSKPRAACGRCRQLSPAGRLEIGHFLPLCSLCACFFLFRAPRQSERYLLLRSCSSPWMKKSGATSA